MTSDVERADRPALSGAAKVLWAFGAAGLVLLAVCGGGGYWAYRMDASSATQDPDAIRRTTDEIVTIAIPASLAPRNGQNGNLFGAKQARYFGKDVGTLTLTQFNETVLYLHPNEREKIKNQAERLKPKAGQLMVVDVDVFESVIHDQPATFTIGNGTDDAFWIVTGEFQGKDGPVLMEMNVVAPAFTREQVMELLKSMK